VTFYQNLSLDDVFTLHSRTEGFSSQNGKTQMSNLLDGIKGHITSSLLEQVSGALGESQSGVSSALGGLIPTILGGLVNKAEDSSGFGQIFDMINKNGDSDLLGNLGGLINQGNLAQNDPKDAAGHLMSSLFGNKVGTILSSITSMAGLKSKSSSSALLGLAGPLIMSFLKKKIMGDKMGASGLASLLLGQKDSIFAAIPSALSSQLGFSTPNIPSTSNAQSSGSSIWKWLLPLLLVGAAAMYFLRGCDAKEGMSDMTDTIENTASDAANAVSDAASGTADALGDAASGAADAANNAVDAVASLFKKTLPGGVEISANADGVEAQLIQFIEGGAAVDKTTWFNFDALNFKTASAELDMAYSQAQINNLAAIMKAFPKVNLKLGGYTDSDGADDANLKLSQARANNVMAAIINKGIAASRLEAEGYGEAHPLCPANDTPECKAQNRRTAVRVTAK
jgi:outer membrane protein OmpA-like peptidoglycan-associated protein